MQGHTYYLVQYLRLTSQNCEIQYRNLIEIDQTYSMPIVYVYVYVLACD